MGYHTVKSRLAMIIMLLGLAWWMVQWRLALQKAWPLYMHSWSIGFHGFYKWNDTSVPVVMMKQTVQQRAFTWSQGITQGIYLLVPFFSCINTAVNFFFVIQRGCTSEWKLTGIVHWVTMVCLSLPFFCVRYPCLGLVSSSDMCLTLYLTSLVQSANQNHSS